MHATSGIPIHDNLQQAFSHNNDYRFLKLAIRNELIVLDAAVPVQGDLSADLELLQDLLEDDVPAYVLARLDNPSSQWLAITYVPDTAKVRDKMIYASTRNTLTKSLGSASFPDSLFATHKSDLTPTAYAAHRRHQTAPKPLSAREQEIADVQAAERAATRSGSDGTSAARQNHLGGVGVQLSWHPEVEEAIKTLVSSDVGNRMVMMGIDPAAETLILSFNDECAPNDIGTTLPSSDPVYAFFVWSGAQRRDLGGGVPFSMLHPGLATLVFIYSCPSTSPIKHRMIFSSGVSSVLAVAKDFGAPVAKKIETSDPKEINEAFLRSELALTATEADGKKPFARPRGPARKQR